MRLVTIFCLFFTFFLQAQTQDAWVFFVDKENVQQSIDNPITILTQEAIDRKVLHNIAIDERDVPVNEAYITQIKNQPGITVYAKSKWMNCVYVRGSQSQIDDLLDLSFVIDIEYADKSMNFTPIEDPIPVEDKFWLENTTQKAVIDYGDATNQVEMLDGDCLHDEGYTGEGMLIAILDSGFLGVGTEEGFAYIRDDGRILGTYDFVERSETLNNNSSHGTRVLSTIGGYLEGDYAGTAIDASFYLFKTEDVDSETPVEEAYWVEAVERADSLGVHVINTSLGYRAYDNSAYSHTYQDLDGQTTFSARGANIGFEKGLIMVTSAGNSGNSEFPWGGTPGDSPGMLTIGAVDEFGDYASFSSIGPTVDGRIKPDVMAQGRDAVVINHNNEIVENNGTSFSSPITAGLVACLWQARPERTNGHVMNLIRQSAHLYNNPTDQMGYGIPNFEEALNALLSVESSDIGEFMVYPNPTTDRLYINAEINSPFEVTLFDVLGNKVLQARSNSSQYSISLAQLQSGVYVLELQTATSSKTIKIIKK